MFAGFERSLDGCQGRAILAADQFDKDINVFGARQFDRIADPFDIAQIDTAISVPGACAHGNGDDGTAALPLQLATLCGEHADDARTDCSESGNSNAQGCGHTFLDLSDAPLSSREAEARSIFLRDWHSRQKR